MGAGPCSDWEKAGVGEARETTPAFTMRRSRDEYVGCVGECAAAEMDERLHQDALPFRLDAGAKADGQLWGATRERCHQGADRGDPHRTTGAWARSTSRAIERDV